MNLHFFHPRSNIKFLFEISFSDKEDHTVVTMTKIGSQKRIQISNQMSQNS